MAPEPILRGKVREVYAAGEGHLAMVASDRISAYDVILPTPIPDKGRVLTGLSAHWFARTSDIVPNHLLSTRLDDLPAGLRDPHFAGRTMLVRTLQMLPIECVARGYLVGSGWRDYLETGAVCGHPLPAGLEQAARLPEPIFTPATKAQSGHDENITREQAADLVGAAVLAEAERITLALYTRAAAACQAAGIILADTKFELGHDPATGEITLGDEAVTPDSSRLWPADGWRTGASPPSFDKQYVRDWLDASGWDHAPPGPDLPHDVVEGTRDRYVDAYERITGGSFADYLRENR
ncbi:MAG: phosphoribosylaminoimidazolesuccinocarboxamide synthase [Miltoncostaeaceae bacterium]